MTEPIPPSLLLPLEDLGKWLGGIRARSVIVSGIAVSFLHRPRFTQDIDALRILPESVWEHALAAAPRYGIVARIDDALVFATAAAGAAIVRIHYLARLGPRRGPPLSGYPCAQCGLHCDQASVPGFSPASGPVLDNFAAGVGRHSWPVRTSAGGLCRHPHLGGRPSLSKRVATGNRRASRRVRPTAGKSWTAISGRTHAIRIILAIAVSAGGCT